MAQAQRDTSSHYFGVTMLNLAMNSIVQDRLEDAYQEVSQALEALDGLPRPL